MTASHSDDHLGRLVVHSRPDIETEVQSVSWGETRAALEALARHESPTVRSYSGIVYLLDGLSFVAAWWVPDGGAS